MAASGEREALMAPSGWPEVMCRQCHAGVLLVFCQVIGVSLPALIRSGLAVAVGADRGFGCQR